MVVAAIERCRAAGSQDPAVIRPALGELEELRVLSGPVLEAADREVMPRRTRRRGGRALAMASTDLADRPDVLSATSAATSSGQQQAGSLVDGRRPSPPAKCRLFVPGAHSRLSAKPNPVRSHGVVLVGHGYVLGKHGEVEIREEPARRLWYVAAQAELVHRESPVLVHPHLGDARPA